MTVVYDKLFSLLKTRDISQKQINEDLGINMQKFRNNDHINTRTICELCEYLNCEPYDIIDFISNNQREKEIKVKLNDINKQIESLQNQHDMLSKELSSLL